jgi:hypothetical protein
MTGELQLLGAWDCVERVRSFESIKPSGDVLSIHSACQGQERMCSLCRAHTAGVKGSVVTVWPGRLLLRTVPDAWGILHVHNLHVAPALAPAYQLCLLYVFPCLLLQLDRNIDTPPPTPTATTLTWSVWFAHAGAVAVTSL